MEPPPTAVELAGLEAASRLESRQVFRRPALTAYQTLMSGAEDPRVRAEALAGIARIQREQGDFDAATDSYRRLDSEFGGVRTAGGIPFSIAAGWNWGAPRDLRATCWALP